MQSIHDDGPPQSSFRTSARRRCQRAHHTRGHCADCGGGGGGGRLAQRPALPSDRPCPATPPHSAHPRHAKPGPQAAYEHEPNPAPRAFISSPAQSTSPPVPVASVPRRVPRRQMSAGSLQRPGRPPTRLSAQALGDMRPPRALAHPSLIDNSGTAPPPQPPRRSPPTHRAGSARHRPTAAARTSTERTSSARRDCDSPTSSSTRRGRNHPTRTVAEPPPTLPAPPCPSGYVAGRPRLRSPPSSPGARSSSPTSSD